MFIFNLYFFVIFIEYFFILNNSKSIVFFYIFFIIIYFFSKILYTNNNLNYLKIINNFSLYNSYIKNNVSYFYYIKIRTDLLYLIYKLITFYFYHLYLKIEKIIKLNLHFFITNILNIKKTLLLYKNKISYVA